MGAAITADDVPFLLGLACNVASCRSNEGQCFFFFFFSFVLCDSVKEELRIYIGKTTLNSLNYNIVVFTATSQLLSLFMSHAK